MAKWNIVDEKYFYLDKKLKIFLVIVLLVFVIPYNYWIGPYIENIIPESLRWLSNVLGAAVLSIPIGLLVGVIGRILVKVGLLVPGKKKSGNKKVK